SAETQLTPMMTQYRRIKGELPKDALLLFRLGDFYEMFFEDAQTGAQILNLALTARNGVPMCGLPFHAANAYVGRLLRSGRKVAICDQMEDARPGQLVKREVTQILSPGTHFDERMLTAERNNFLAAVYQVSGACGLACADLTTGEFLTTEVEDSSALLTELQRLRPAEIIYPSESEPLRQVLQSRDAHSGRAFGRAPAAPPALAGTNPNPSPAAPGAGATTAQSASRRADFGWILSGYESWVFAPETAQFTVRDHFKVASLDGFGLKNKPAATGAAGAVLHYLTQHLRRDVAHLTTLSCYQTADFLMLDITTLRHLEILEPLRRDATRAATLFGALNRTVTPMGARRLRDWLSQPLAAAAPIARRLDAVRAWLDNTALL